MSTARPPDEDDWETDAQPAPEALVRSASRLRPILRWSVGGVARSIPVDARAVIGSAPAADVVLADRTASRLHAEVERRDDGLWLRDLDSTNGTFVAGLRVREVRVPVGAIIRIGATELEVTDDSAPTRVDLWPSPTFGSMVGVSAGMRELFAHIATVAASDLTVLVEGETGTGKELVARSIHDGSPRVRQPFVIVDCAALPENLLEAELFGHTRGAFSGATAARVGAIEEAEGGTVFLDEVGELPLSMQPKLLRAIESRSVRRLGENQFRNVNVRFVTATHRNLRRMVNTGAFREDLYFRLAVVPITIPPLRERREDIPALIARFTKAGSANALSEATVAELAQRPWIGNVRELRNYVERALVLGRDAADRLADAHRREPTAADRFPAVPLDRPFKEVRDEWIDHLERAYVRGLMARHHNNIPAAAEAARLDRTYMYRLGKKHGLDDG